MMRQPCSRPGIQGRLPIPSCSMRVASTARVGYERHAPRAGRGGVAPPAHPAWAAASTMRH
eukprot:1377617-Alexandrium_andersonii.AAC.1